ncbi:uncharacterized protein LOC142548343 [Primulina tabacum]|uniref:uncharacterized protein LOC142548343 n=1 Tax=Primulina tabacum TaxID=48773 RepID=UPI003F59E765
MNSVSKEIFGGIVYAIDASTVWTDLKEQYDKVNGSRIFSLHREIGRLTQAGNTVSSYYCRLKQLWDEYSSLVVLPSCECATARQYIVHDQQQKLLQFLMGLNEIYISIRSQILMMSPLPSVGQAFSIISQEESHRSLSTVEPPSTAFFSAQSKQNYQKKDALTCDYCNWNGHTREFCYKLVGYPPGHKLYKAPHTKKGQHGRIYRDNPRTPRPSANLSEGAQTEASTLTNTDDKNTAVPSIFTPAQYAEILKLLGTCKVQSPAEPVVNMAGTSTKPSMFSHWIIDSGANEHMVGDSSLLRNPSSVALPSKFVRLPNGDKAAVNKIGSVLLNDSITLDHDLKTGRLMEIGKECNGLYHLNTRFFSSSNHSSVPSIPSLDSLCNNSVHSCSSLPIVSDDSFVWHKRLGHMSMSRMQLLPFMPKSVKFPHCPVCPLSKQTRVQFPSMSLSKSSCCFALVHVDSMGAFSYSYASWTLHEVLLHRPPSFSHLCVFGCLCYVTSLTHKDKFSARASACVFLDYSTNQKGYKVMSLDAQKFFVSRDVVFHESIFPFASPSHPQPIFPSPDFSSTPSDPVEVTSSAPSSPLDGPALHEVPNSVTVFQPPRKSLRTPKPPIWTKDYSCPTLSHSNLASSSYPLTQYLTHSKFSQPYQSFLASISLDREPSSYHEAILDPRWKAAMDLELAAIESNHTWDLVPLPVGKKPIGCRWVYKIKRHPDGTVDRFKARLVAKGYTQQEGIDYHDTFFPYC